MIVDLTMPQLGESVTEGTISKWLVREGDRVEQYAPICEVITDKVIAEVPATHAGVIVQLLVAEGETVRVGAVIARLATDASLNESELAAVDGADHAQKMERPSDTPAAKSENPKQNGTGITRQNANKRRFSPAVLKLAEMHGVDLSRIHGSGEGGRITRKDVLAYIDAEQTDPAKTKKALNVESSVAAFADLPPFNHATPSLGSTAPFESSSKEIPSDNVVSLNQKSGDMLVAISPVRRAIAERMKTSKHEAPHAWTMIEVDVTSLVRYRNEVKERFREREGFHLTYLPFFIKATVDALKQYPVLNAEWTEEGILHKKDIHISIAVAHDDLLYVPVIKNADEKNVLGLARAIDNLIHRTRTKQLTPDDVRGGTFTVNNTGAFGSILSMPIINYPQAAILSVEAIVKRPVVIDQMIAIRDIVHLTLSIDHRVLDGYVAGQFLQTIKRFLERFDPDQFAI